VPLDVTDVESDDSVIEHDDTNTDRIQIKEDGIYEVSFKVVPDLASATYVTVTVEGRIRLNDTSVVPGSQVLEGSWANGDDIMDEGLDVCVIDEFSAGDYLTLQLMYSQDTPDSIGTQSGLIVVVRKLDGVTGATGPTGAAGGGLSKLFQGVDTQGGLTITNVSQVIELDYESIKDDHYAHSTTVNPGEVTILEEGWYKISAMMTVASQSDTGGIRGNPELHIEIDSGSGWVEQPDQMGGYVRENSTEALSTSITGVGLFYFNENDKLRLTVYDTVTDEPDEATLAYSQRLVIEYIDRTGSASGVVSNLKDIGDVSANAPTLGSKLYFDTTDSTWKVSNLPVKAYTRTYGTDWAPTMTQLEAHGPAAYFNTGIAATSHVGNGTVAYLNGISATAGDSYTATDSGTLTAGSLPVTPGTVVAWNGSAWIYVAPGSSSGYVRAGIRLQLSTTTALISPYTDGVDDGKIFAFDDTDLTGVETTADLTFTLPDPTDWPNDKMFRGPLYVGNFTGENALTIDIEDSGSWSDGLEKVVLTESSESVMLGVVNGDLAQKWLRISSVQHYEQLRRAATWAAANFSSAAGLPFDTQDRAGNDALSEWAVTPNPSRVTFNFTGFFLIGGFANIDSTGGSTWNVECWLRKNGTTEVAGSRIRTGNYGGEDQALTLTPILVEVEDGDYIEWVFDHTSLTGSLYSATFMVSKVY